MNRKLKDGNNKFRNKVETSKGWKRNEWRWWDYT